MLPTLQLQPISISYLKLTISLKRLNICSLFFGFFTKKWSRVQHNFLIRNQLPHDKKEACTDIFQIGLLFARLPKKLWDLRNHDRHTLATKQVSEYIWLLLLSKVETLYNLEPHVLYFDNNTFYSTTFAECQTQFIQQLQTYVDYY